MRFLIQLLGSWECHFCKDKAFFKVTSDFYGLPINSLRYKTCGAANSSTIGLGRVAGKIRHLVLYNAEWRKPPVLNICCCFMFCGFFL